MVKIKVKVGNVYTSKGQLFQGDEADLPEAEIKIINDIRADAVLKVAGQATPKRARNEKGQVLPDDPTTLDINEAWEGGKAPAKKKAKANAKA